MMIWTFLTIVILSTIKTLFAPSIGFAAGMSFMTTFAATALGAVLGFVAFYYFSSQIMSYLNKRKNVKDREKQMRRARKIVNMKKKYPLWAFVFILPFTSIPIMAVIIKKFYSRDKRVFALSLVAAVAFAALGCVICSPIQLIN